MTPYITPTAWACLSGARSALPRAAFCVNYREGTQEELTYTYGILKPGACMFRAMPLERAHAFAEQLRQKAEIPLFIATNLEKGGNGILTEGNALCLADGN